MLRYLNMKKLLLLLLGLFILYGINNSQQQTLNPNVANPGSTANLREVRRVLNHNDSLLFLNGGNVSSITKQFLDTITFSNLITNYGSVIVNKDSIVRLDTVGKHIGNGAIIRFIGDGEHYLSLSGFVNYDIINFDNTLNMENIFVFSYDGRFFNYRIIQQRLTTENTAPVASGVKITGNNNYGDTLRGHYIYSDNDGDVIGTPTYSWTESSTSGGSYTAITGATTNLYIPTIADVNKFIKFNVTPTALTGISPGYQTSSSYVQISNNDPDATAYLTAAGIPNDATVYYPSTAQQITGAEIWTAVNNFFVGVKLDTLYTKIAAMYLIIGGTASSDKWNAKDPRDLDEAYRITFNGSITHSALGMVGTSSGYGNTHFTFNSTDTVGGLFYYCQTVNVNAGEQVDMGTKGTKYFQMGTGRYTTNWLACPFTTVALQGTQISPGYFSISRYNTSSTGGTIIASNGGYYTTSVTAPYVSPTPTYPVYILANDNANTAENFTLNRDAFFAIWRTALQNYHINKFYLRVNALETALHRNPF